MKLPILWLKKYVPLKVSPEKLADLLTLSGTSVESVEKKDGETVLDIEVTTNRPDCLGILGLAREVSALTGVAVRVPAPYLGGEKKAVNSKKSVEVTVEDKKGCPRYTARLIEGVSVRPAPPEVQKCLVLTGARPLSNVVDATNFVLFESGQPLHAFDFEKLKGGRILVRRARSGEKFLGIDGVEYTLDTETLVIADAENPVAIAGVIGGRHTEVTAGTTKVLLESAFFDPALVRRASKKYKISTESSYRFERGVNPDTVRTASKRAADLICEWAGGSTSTGLVDKNHLAKRKPASILLRAQRLKRLLGAPVAPGRVSAILNRLSFSAKPAGVGKWKVLRTNSRGDVRQETDLIEEVLRIEGFEKIPARLPVTRHTSDGIRDEKAERSLDLKKWLAAVGFSEIVSTSLLPAKFLSDSGIDAASCHRITNASSAEQEFFRPSLLPGMLQAVLFNVHRKAQSLKLFEIGNVCSGPKEKTHLALAVYGHWEENWQRKSQASYYDLKGVLERLFDFLGTGDGQRSASFFGKVPDETLKKWDIPHPVFFTELALDEALQSPRPVVRARPVPKFPSVRRDIAFIVDESVSVGDLQAKMKKSGAPYLRNAVLFDQFKGKNISAGKRSLAFSLAYQKETGTFTDDEISAIQKRLGDDLKREFGVEFR